MNILFVDKYNRFRSKVAKAYFNKVKKQGWKAKSAGLVPGIPISKEIHKAAKQMGAKIKGEPIGLTHQLLMWSDKIIIVDNKISPSVFREEKINDKKEVIQWKIPDIANGNINGRISVIRSIFNRINKLLR